MQHPTSSTRVRNRALLLLGPTGSGKTPLGAMIERRGLGPAKWFHFDFGANLRDVVRRNCPDRWIGREEIEFLREVLRSGALLEDEHFPIARRILESFLARRGATQDTRIVLNGLPRHVGQARAIDQLLDVRTVVYLQCSSETVCQRIRNNIGGDRASRPDDDLHSVRSKLAIFNRRTTPLLEHYVRSAATVETVEVTAEMTAQRMWEMLEEAVGHDDGGGRTHQPE